MILGVFATSHAQDIRFSFTVSYPTTTTAELQVFAQKIAGSTENMAGYTTNVYYDNAETTLTSFDSSPSTALGWDVSDSNTAFVANNNPTVTSTHTGYGTIDVIDQNIVGTEVDNTPIHILTINFDNTVGDPMEGGLAFLAASANNHSEQEYVGNDFTGHAVVITGTQVLGLNEGALPVDLLSFSAIAVDNKRTQLDWKTASEENNDYFEMQRSIDGRNFEAIGEESGIGTSSEIQNYKHWDEAPFVGKNYYRLKQVDFDGNFEYSEVRVVEFKGTNNLEISVFPNPTTTYLNIEYGSSIASTEEMVLYNVAGKVITQFTLTNGDRHQIDVSGYPSGTYFLQALNQGPIFTEQIIIKHD